MSLRVRVVEANMKFDRGKLGAEGDLPTLALMLYTRQTSDFRCESIGLI